jgi:hypothetical protein
LAPVSGSNSVIASSSSPKKDSFQAAVFEVGGPDLEAVAAHPEGAALKRLIVAAVLLGDEIGHHLALVVFAPTCRSCVIAP